MFGWSRFSQSKGLAGFVPAMAPRKVGKKKGKQLSKKVTQKWPAPPISDSEDEGDREDQRVILKQHAALERAQGLSPGGPVDLAPTKLGWGTRQVSMKQFQVQVCSRLLCLA